jgi:CDP-diacylglycerol---glycerol-3-phosphate 3-phosphatidyltransferase
MKKKDTINNNLVLISLRYRWLLTAILLIGILLFTSALLQTIWPYATRWALIAGMVLAYNLYVLWTWLPDNHREGENKLLPTYGLGNSLTLVRGLLIAFVAGFIGLPWLLDMGILAWLPMLFCTIAFIADYFDGYLARMTNHATVLGSKLDLEFDILGVSVVTLLAIWYGQLPWWYLILGMAGYFFRLGLWWRKRQGLPIYELPPSIHRRIFAGFQMGFLSVSLWPILPAEAVTLAGIGYGTFTALGFLRDWLVVSGRIDPTAPTYRKIQRWLFVMLTRWLPPLLRLALLISILMIYSIIANPFQPQQWVELFTTWHLIWPNYFATVVTIVAILGTFTTLLGIAGRMSCILLFFPIGFETIIHGLLWANTIALMSTLYLSLLGTGYFSLWQPEEKLFTINKAKKLTSQ